MRKVLLALLLLCLALPAFGWGQDGHRIVCRIAWHELSEEQQEEVDRLTRNYGRHNANFANFAQSCIFADNVRDIEEFKHLGPMHFLNLQRDENQVSDSQCPAMCVLRGIRLDTEKLRNATDEQDRAEALFFLGHWYGDIHQPLHISFADDKGGNDINRINGGFYARERNNLHKIWDSGILLKMMGESWGLFADELSDRITDAQREAWKNATPVEMAQESFTITIAPRTLYCRLDNSGECDPRGATRTLRREYQNQNDDIVKERLQRAGVRLAEAIKANLPND